MNGPEDETEEDISYLLDEIRDKIDTYLEEGGNICEIIEHLASASYVNTHKYREDGDDASASIWESIARDLENLKEEIGIRVYG